MPDAGVDEGQEGEAALAPTHGPRESRQQELGQAYTSLLPCRATVPPWKTNVALSTSLSCRPCFPRPPQPQDTGGNRFWC